MIHSAPAGVKAFARTANAATRQIQFAFRADPVALDELRLPRTARDVFALVLDNARSRGGPCRLTNAVMARVLGCSAPTIKRALAALETAGLIRRETIAQGRIRLCIHVTWDGVDHRRSTVQTTVDHSRPGGGSPTIRGVDHPRSTNQSPIQSGDQTGPILPMEGEDPEEAALYAALGPAKYLQAMIAKGKAEAAARKPGTPAPCPAPVVASTPETAAPSALPAEAPRPSQDGPSTRPPVSPDPATDRPTKATPAPSPAMSRRKEARPNPRAVVMPSPCVPPDQVAAMVGRMVNGLASCLKSEDVGRRRVGPVRLARQLAEVRRRHSDGRPR